MPTLEDLSPKRAKLLALAAKIPERCRLVEKSPGASLIRKVRKLGAFGPRYLTWALNKKGWLKSAEVSFPLFFGRSLRLPFKMEDDFITLYLTGALGGPEFKLTNFFIKNLKADDIFYDVGASYGFYSFLAAEFVGAERVHAFEPLPEIFATLKTNAEGPEHFNNIALWDKAGRSEINMHHLGHGFSTLSPEMVAIDPPRAGRKLAVETTTLDEYVKNHAAPTMMKVDIEGAEEKFVAGGARCLSESGPVVSMEVIAGDAAERLSLKALDKMLALGYSAFALTDGGDLRGPLSSSEWADRLQKMARGNAADQISWDNVIFQKGSWKIAPLKG
jgi:FkbM family methyltransferase